MRRRHVLLGIILASASFLASHATTADPIALVEQPDLPPQIPTSLPAGVTVQWQGEHDLVIIWPMAHDEHGRLALDSRPDRPLIAFLNISGAHGPGAAIVEGADPVTFLTVGTRVAPPDRPPGMSEFNTFFDAPAKRPHESYRSRLDRKRFRISADRRSVTVTAGELTIGPFSGELRLTIYAGARLVHVEAVVKTQEDHRAALYDAGLVSETPSWRRFGWVDTEGRHHREDADPRAGDRSLAVRHRAIVAESGGGALACFPPPHQYFFARDLTDNLRYAWTGRGHRGLEDRTGFGIRQSETGGGNFAPWINAPPGSEQHFGVFYLLARGTAEDALRETLRYTHGDRFPALPGHRTFTSHWHMAIALAALREQAEGKGRTTPDFVRMFKEMGVEIVHLAEFHGDGHPRDPGPIRLPEMEAMFAECRRLSDSELLLLPGEEANAHLGTGPGKQPGHWLYLFPRPVYWTMTRRPGEPFVEEVPRLGTVYHTGNEGDVFRLLEAEHGLAWTAHPRIKASSWAPDIYRESPFYKSDRWLGAAWKGMPVDTSRPRLGQRALDLLDDMANWGGPKYLLGEVDVFKIDHTHELYGHMNINYMKLDRVPRFDDGWAPVLDSLRAGRFFVTTGEILIRDFAVGGKPSGATLAATSPTPAEVRIDLEWTFPLRFAEVISGDGKAVYRDRIDLSDTGPFGRRTLSATPDLRGRTWARAEVWDVAGNGAFTQPVWLQE
jgi:hypothetical protein